MYNNRLLGTIAVFVVLAGMLVGVGQKAALGQQAPTFPTTGGSGDLTSGAAPALAVGRGPYASLQVAPVSTGSQMRYGPPGR